MTNFSMDHICYVDLATGKKVYELTHVKVRNLMKISGRIIHAFRRLWWPSCCENQQCLYCCWGHFLGNRSKRKNLWRTRSLLESVKVSQFHQWNKLMHLFFFVVHKIISIGSFVLHYTVSSDSAERFCK